MAGRPRTPTNVLALRGAFKHDPARGRERADEPRDDRPLGDCPPSLTDEQAAAWAELVDMAPAGVLAHVDRGVMELAARAMASLREPTMEIVSGRGENAQVLTIAKEFDSKAAATLIKCLVEMGFTPASRSKVKVAQRPGGPPSGFDAL